MRQYDPSLGLFISVDPLLDIADPKQALGYAYANYNPVTFSDPSGLMLIDAGNGGSSPSPLLVVPEQTSPISAVIYGASNLDTYTVCSGWVAAYVAPKGGGDSGAGTMSWGDVFKQTGKNLTSPSWYDENQHGLAEELGYVPVIGDSVDAIDGAVYLFEGDYKNAMFSAIAVVPIAGSPLKTALKHGDDVADGASSLLKHSDEAEQAISDVAKNRVKLRVDTKAKIQGAASKTSDGDFIDPNTYQVIPRGGPFHYGHKPNFEWWRTQQMARSEGWSRKM